MRLGLLALLLVSCAGQPLNPCSPVAGEALQAVCLEAIGRAPNAAEAHRIRIACEVVHEARCL